MKRGMVFVRAQTPSGRWVSADVLDLTEDSFRAFVVDRMIQNDMVVSLFEDRVPGNRIDYKTVTEVE